jgi:hypothetical protein
MADSTYAKILKDGSVKICSAYSYWKWKEFGPGKRLSKLQYNATGNYSLAAGFNGESRSVDGPHLWWETVVVKYESSAPARQKNSPDGFLDVFTATLRKRCSTLRELFKSESEAVYSERLATPQEALATYQVALKSVRVHVIHSSVRPEPSQELLAQLAFWCEKGWGRQTALAKELGTTPQRVNDWLNGRKKMNADQALFVSEFLRLKQQQAKRKTINQPQTLNL